MAAAGSRKFGRKKKKAYVCVICRNEPGFCWTCSKCGFQICQDCIRDNLWGMTCNNIEWECPDCGAWNGFGNQ